ncbi:hypothetical protein RJ640_022437 [Escallonia rubra]|uniref:NB-ARC domain-containing protein n=1 Tax=Escallonia rubra TaxID=112253 RepID=A0AA88RJ73_9ASTE|nr:hypothetical protein RJ640_022437 [Escallonia rubra]
MPGVGKTTMMEQVRNAMVEKKEFEEVAFAVVSATWDVKSIQGRLASDLRLYDLANADDESVRARLLRERLKNGKKILVILDDVWDKLTLEDMGLDFGDSRGCKILMTSRSERVCEANKCLRNFLINVLSQEEALGLFRQHAGNCIEDADINPVAKEILKGCGGLPLIIRAVGEALKYGEQREWKDARRQFKNFTPRKIVNLDDQVYQTLELSFSRLKPEEAKSCLLLCSLFPEDAEISIDDLSLLAMAMGFLGSMDSIEDARNRVLSLVKALKTSCLLLGCEDGDSVKLHDVIRDVAINIASEDDKYTFMVKSVVSAWPQMHEAHRATISLRIQNIPELPRKLECPHDQLETLMLDCSGDSYTKIPRTFLDGLEKLTVYLPSLERLSLEGVGLPKLQSLWNGDHRGILDLRSLTEIKIEHCGLLKMLFSCSVVRALEQLRQLTVADCPMLETIVYDDEGKEGTGDDDIEFPRLKFLKLNELPKLSSFCSAKVSGPLHMRKTTKEYLEISFCEASTLVSPNWLHNLQELRVESCDEARELFDLQGLNAREQHVQLLSRMSTLRIDGLPKLQSLWNGDPRGILDLRSLTEIQIWNCGHLKMLFSCSVARDLEQLRQLTVGYCAMLETIVYDDEGKEGTGDDIEFPRLKFLKLRELPKLSSFCSAKVSGPLHMRKTTKEYLEVFFPSLEELHLRHVGFSPLEIGHRAESFCNLRLVKISLCEASTLVSPNWLHSLQELQVENCVEARELFDLQGLNARDQHVRLLSRMSTLRIEIDGLPKLQSLWNGDPRGILDLRSLTEIEIKNCGLLKMLFSCSVARALEQLWKLTVKDCPMMETIVYDDEGKEGTSDDDIEFPRLELLYLEELPKLSSFCSAKVSGPLDMPKMTKEHLEVFFPSLEELHLRHVGFSPLEIGHRAESFCNLRLVNISLCEASTLVSPNWLQNLQELQVENCVEARELFDLQGLNAREQHVRLLSRMSTLRIEIDGLPKLQSLWNGDPRGILDLRSLTEIKIENCGLLKMLFSCSVARALEQLQKLTVACCPMMETIVYDDEGKEGTGDDIEFPRLKFLELEKLPKLSSFCSAKVSGPLDMPKMTKEHLEVFFPSLEELHLRHVGFSPLEIGHRAESFCNLRLVKISLCEASTLVSPNWLQYLQELQVENCVEARELFDLQGLNARDQHVRLLSRMSTLTIHGLPKLQSLWNGDPRGILDLRSLTEIEIKNCGLLKMLFSCSVARALEQLRKLTVACCPMLETIVYDDEGKEGTGDDDIEFPRLELLYLSELPKLSSFCSAKVSGPLHMRKTTKEHLEVFFPSLEELHLYRVGFSPLEIGHRAESFCNLRRVIISECEVSTLVSPNWLVSLQNLQELDVRSCDEARELFDLRGLNAREQHGWLLSRISTLEVYTLPKLRSLWNKDPRGILDLRSLTEIKIVQCDLLKMFFSCSVVRTLEHLRVLVVKSCPMMETIVYDDMGKEGTNDDIEFPRLEFLHLAELPMLSSFCNAKVALTMSSLKAARLRKCLQMLRFSSGGLHLPKMTILSSPARSSHVADLKEHLQASAIEINDSDFDDEELATDGEGLTMDKDSDDI